VDRGSLISPTRVRDSNEEFGEAASSVLEFPSSIFAARSSPHSTSAPKASTQRHPDETGVLTGPPRQAELPGPASTTARPSPVGVSAARVRARRAGTSWHTPCCNGSRRPVDRTHGRPTARELPAGVMQRGGQHHAGRFLTADPILAGYGVRTAYARLQPPRRHKYQVPSSGVIVRSLRDTRLSPFRSPLRSHTGAWTFWMHLHSAIGKAVLFHLFPSNSTISPVSRLRNPAAQLGKMRPTPLQECQTGRSHPAFILRPLGNCSDACHELADQTHLAPVRQRDHDDRGDRDQTHSERYRWHRLGL
jgi:hypothetical protein